MINVRERTEKLNFLPFNEMVVTKGFFIKFKGGGGVIYLNVPSKINGG